MVDVLYVEDNPNDADIFSRLMHKLNKSVTYAILSNAPDALDYLTGGVSDQKATMPRLLLLDMDLGGISGYEVIAKTRASDRTKYLPIVAFSTSDSPKDIQQAYDAGINAYVVKPGTYQATGTALSKMCDFWLENNTLADSK